MKKEIHNLVKVLETLQDKLDFTVFYSFADFLKSIYSCPAFEFEGLYYEIQHDNSDELQILDFGYRGCKDVGDKLTKYEVSSLTRRLEEYGKRRG